MTHMRTYDTAVLLLGFGGPTDSSQVESFVERILNEAKVKIPQERFEEVTQHYKAVGDASPYNFHVFRQRDALQHSLAKEEISLPVLVGFCFAPPFFSDIIMELKKKEIKRLIGFVLAPHRSAVSFGRYQYFLERAKKEAEAEDIEVTYVPAWHEHPLFIEALSHRIKESLQAGHFPKNEQTFFLFSAHSIPVTLSDESGYADQVKRSSELVASALGISHWGVAFQSRSGNPKEAWLVPSVQELVQLLDTHQVKNVVVVPIGFLCDNVELLYDLDIELKKFSESRGLRYARVPTVADHPSFIRMMTSLIHHQLKEVSLK